MQESSLTRSLSEALAAGEEFSPLVQACESQRRRILRDCQLVLTGRQMMLLVMRYEDECTFGEIAIAFDISIVAVWKAHERIRRILRAELAARSIVVGSQL